MKTASTDRDREQDWLSSTEAAKHLQLSEETVRRGAREGRLPGRRLYEGGHWRFKLDDLDHLINPEEAQT